jgi:hypothetical protein
MVNPADHGGRGTRYEPKRCGIAAAVVLASLGWLLVLGGLGGTISALPRLGWAGALSVVVLCGSQLPALWMTRRAIVSRRIAAIVPPSLLDLRCHGTLETITDSERRSLRSIAATAQEVAARTGELLADLIAIPSVRIFRGVQSAGLGQPLIPHAISAGRELILVESVAWPSGHYETTRKGAIHCDGAYIGQSVGPLISAVHYWQGILPRGHHVSACVVVHAVTGGRIALPGQGPEEVAWMLAENAIRELRQRVLRGHPAVSRNVVAALLGATADRARTAGGE